MSNNFEAGGSNDPLPPDPNDNDNNNDNDNQNIFSNLPNDALAIVFRETFDDEQVVPILANYMEQIKKLKTRIRALEHNRDSYLKQANQTNPETHEQLWQGSLAIANNYEQQIAELEEDIKEIELIASPVRDKFIFYMTLLKRL